LAGEVVNESQNFDSEWRCSLVGGVDEATLTCLLASSSRNSRSGNPGDDGGAKTLYSPLGASFFRGNMWSVKVGDDGVQQLEHSPHACTVHRRSPLILLWFGAKASCSPLEALFFRLNQSQNVWFVMVGDDGV
jgi:hypothetical protein